MSFLRNPRVAVPAAVGVVVALVAIALIRGWPVGVYYDDGLYLVLARSIATGEGYRFLNLPGHPAATHYPPGYPAFLALLWSLAPGFPDNAVVFKLANAVLLGVAAYGAVRMYRDTLGLPAPLSAATALAFTVSIPVLVATGVLFSEPLFLAVLLPALVASQRAAGEGDDSAAIVAGVLCAATALIRTVGMAAVLGTLVVMLWRRRTRRTVLFAAAAGVFLLPWQLWSALHGRDVPATLTASYGPYASWVMDAIHVRGPLFPLQVAQRNAGELIRPIRFFAGHWPFPSLGLFPFATAALALGAGIAVSFRRAPVIPAFLAAYFLVILTWPYLPDRFLWGVWPVVGGVFVLGTVEVMRWLSSTERLSKQRQLRTATQIVFAAGMALATVSYLRYNVIGLRRGWFVSAQKDIAEAMKPVSRWVSERTLVTDIIATDGDPLIYLYTGRESVPLTRAGADEYVSPLTDSLMVESLRARLAAFPVNYVMIMNPTDATGRAAMRLANSQPAELAVVDTFANGGLVFAPVTPRRNP